MYGKYFVLVLALSSYGMSQKVININLDGKRIATLVSEKFLSIGLEVKNAFSDHAWKTFSSSNFVEVAKALSPCYLRVGGNSAEEVIFNPVSNHRLHWMENDIDPPKSFYFSHKKNITNFTVTAQNWDFLNEFVKKVNYSFIFDLNAFLRNGDDWDPSNAIMLMKYTAGKGYTMAGWELGNEPNLYPNYDHTVEAAQCATDYEMLKSLLDAFPKVDNIQLIGPSVTHLTAEKAQDYFTQFLKYSKGDSITAATFHHYYIDGRTASVYDFLDPRVLDSLLPNIIIGKHTLNEFAPGKKLWLGETGSAFGGGAKGLSDRYVAGFMWLDKLGMASREGVDVVIRQTLIGGNYEMIDKKSLVPNPDFWLSLLYKKLVGPQVLTLKSSDTKGLVRVYAYCSTSVKYIPGSVTLSWMNLDTEEVHMNATVFSNHPIHMYLLEPFGPDKLKSKDVSLNGVHLLQKEDGSLPDVLQPHVIQEPVTLPPLTFGFLVLPGKDVAPACTKS